MPLTPLLPFSVLAFASLVGLAGCSKARLPVTHSLMEPDEVLAPQITALSRAGVEAWNCGDLASYLSAYAPDVVMVYPTGPEKGRMLLEARLRVVERWEGYPPKRTAQIEKCNVRRLDRDHVLQTALIVTGDGSGYSHQTWVSSIFERAAEGWKVIHEQSF